MNELVFGLSVALIGMGVVFVGLVILIGSIKLISVISADRKGKTAEAPEAATADETVVADGTVLAQDVAGESVSQDVMAAIVAAIAAVWQADTGFTVRRVRRLHNAPAWNCAGRDDQIYSRM